VLVQVLVLVPVEVLVAVEVLGVEASVVVEVGPVHHKGLHRRSQSRRRGYFRNFYKSRTGKLMGSPMGNRIGRSVIG
jgi:hypothetical protein